MVSGIQKGVPGCKGYLKKKNAPWSYPDAAAAGAAAGAAASAATVCIYYVTRCSYLGATCKALGRKLWGEA